MERGFFYQIICPIIAPMKAFDTLKSLIAAAEADVIKADGGNAAAAVRVRAVFQKVKAVAQEGREEALVLKKA